MTISIESAGRRLAIDTPIPKTQLESSLGPYNQALAGLLQAVNAVDSFQSLGAEGQSVCGFSSLCLLSRSRPQARLTRKRTRQ